MSCIFTIKPLCFFELTIFFQVYITRCYTCIYILLLVFFVKHFIYHQTLLRWFYLEKSLHWISSVSCLTFNIILNSSDSFCRVYILVHFQLCKYFLTSGYFIVVSLCGKSRHSNKSGVSLSTLNLLHSLITLPAFVVKSLLLLFSMFKHFQPVLNNEFCQKMVFS